jgi:nucleotide-binding universal stress UspA family protein
MKTIVLGYDETPAAERALERAAELAKAFGSSVIVTSVAQVAPSGPRGSGPIDPTDPPERHNEQLNHAKAKLHDKGIEAETVAGFGEPAKSITELAEAKKADLIVVGTRELGWLERALGQSVSAGVLHHSHCDVLVVH